MKKIVNITIPVDSDEVFLVFEDETLQTFESYISDVLDRKLKDYENQKKITP